MRTKTKSRLMFFLYTVVLVLMIELLVTGLYLWSVS